ncbi:hypothetical protein chiPu_0005189 [Chiloscyllium punctatum]|uniref:Uncharacterized protein n=1 Tax=Chiloscyllium punctatum TaxID=137246 RepID=A0A401S8N7_CHIPU|nr:hypothetical protein [Chiloscyllium punctatum]
MLRVSSHPKPPRTALTAGPIVVHQPARAALPPRLRTTRPRMQPGRVAARLRTSLRRPRRVAVRPSCCIAAPPPLWNIICTMATPSYSNNSSSSAQQQQSQQQNTTTCMQELKHRNLKQKPFLSPDQDPEGRRVGKLVCGGELHSKNEDYYTFVKRKALKLNFANPAIKTTARLPLNPTGGVHFQNPHM